MSTTWCPVSDDLSWGLASFGSELVSLPLGTGVVGLTSGSPAATSCSAAAGSSASWRTWVKIGVRRSSAGCVSPAVPLSSAFSSEPAWDALWLPRDASFSREPTLPLDASFSRLAAKFSLDPWKVKIKVIMKILSVHEACSYERWCQVKLFVISFLMSV